MDTLLDAILRETRRQNEPYQDHCDLCEKPMGMANLVVPGLGVCDDCLKVVNDTEQAIDERSRLLALADRSGPKGALAGWLEDLCSA